MFIHKLDKVIKRPIQDNGVRVQKNVIACIQDTQTLVDRFGISQILLIDDQADCGKAGADRLDRSILRIIVHDNNIHIQSLCLREKRIQAGQDLFLGLECENANAKILHVRLNPLRALA